MNPSAPHDPTQVPIPDEARRREAALRIADAILSTPVSAFPLIVNLDPTRLAGDVILSTHEPAPGSATPHDPTSASADEAPDADEARRREAIYRLSDAILSTVDARTDEDRRRLAAYRLADALLSAPEAAFPGPPHPTPPARTPPTYAYEVTSDGQSIRLEAPTAEGLLNLILRHDEANQEANV